MEFLSPGRTDLPREAIEPKSPIASRGWSKPEFLRKPIATCDFPGWGRGGGEVRTSVPPTDWSNRCLYCALNLAL